MTTDHKPSREDEAARIRAAGGFVINNRVMGELAVSRAFGDADFKKGIQSIIEEEGGPSANLDVENHDWDQPLIVAEPDVEVRNYLGRTSFCFLLATAFSTSSQPRTLLNLSRKTWKSIVTLRDAARTSHMRPSASATRGTTSP